MFCKTEMLWLLASVKGLMKWRDRTNKEEEKGGHTGEMGKLQGGRFRSLRNKDVASLRQAKTKSFFGGLSRKVKRL